MQPSINELLESWEQIKNKSCPTALNIADASGYLRAMDKVDQLAQEVRNCRLINDRVGEMRNTAKFIEAYYDFSKDFVFRTLKNDRTT